MVDQQNCDVPLVRKLLEQTDVLIVIRIQVTVTARTADTLQRINDNELCGWMLR